MPEVLDTKVEINARTRIICSRDSFSACVHRPEDGWKKLAVEGDIPAPRGWFAFSGVSGGAPGGSILVHGGNSPSNERLGDMYMLHLP